MKLWKWLGVAGLAGVAATGVILARDERARRAYTPDDVRARLRERVERLAGEPDPTERSLASAVRDLDENVGSAGQ